MGTQRVVRTVKAKDLNAIGLFEKREIKID